jgi:hypothetical protein
MKDNARTFVAGSNFYFPLDGYPANEPTTFAVVCRTTSMAAVQAALGISADATDSHGRFLRVNPSTDPSSPSGASYYDGGVGGLAGGTVPLSTWNLSIVSKNQVATPNVTTVRIYNFSTQTWEHVTLGSVASSVAYTAGRFIIGNSRVNANVTFAWIGQIAVAAVFRRALSQSEAQALVSGPQATKTLWDAQLNPGDHAWDLTSATLADPILDWVGAADENAVGGGRQAGVTLYTAAGTVPWDTTVVTGFLDFPTLTVSAGSEVAGAGIVGVEIASTSPSSFVATQGTNPGVQNIVVSGPPDTLVTYADDATWLSTTAASFVIGLDGTVVIPLTAATSAFAAGATGTGTITLTPQDGPAITVPVDYQVIAAPSPQLIASTGGVFTPSVGTLPPAAPATVTVTAGNAQIVVTTSAVSGTGVLYEFETQSPDTNAPWVPQNPGGQAPLSRTIPATNGVQIRARVRAVTATGGAGLYTTSSFVTPAATVDTTPPLPVTNVGAVYVGNVFLVTWTASTSGDIRDYLLFQRSTPSSSFVLVDTVNAAPATSQLVSAGQTVTLRVVARDTSLNQATAVDLTVTAPSVASTIVEYDLRLGRLWLPTAGEGIGESFAADMDTIGPIAIAGATRPSSIRLTLPVHAAKGSADSIAEGNRMRRQVRGLLENPRTRVHGLWLFFRADPDLASLLLVTGGELSYGAAGPTFAEYELALNDVVRIGMPFTHRHVVSLTYADMRFSTVARDYLGTVFDDDWAQYPATVFTALPRDAQTVEGFARRIIPVYSRTGTELSQFTVNAFDGESLIFDRDTVEHSSDDVILLSQPSAGFTGNAAGDRDPQSAYGWEEIYGSTQRITGSPVLQNALCRARWIPDRACFAIDVWNSTSGFVEQGRMSAHRNFNGPRYGLPNVLGNPDVRFFAEEWTPERCVLRVSFGGYTQDRADMYLTLQRGWTAPRLEVYIASASAGATVPGALTAQLTWTPIATLAVGMGLNAAVASDETEWAGSETSQASGAPWYAVYGQSALATAVLAVQRHLDLWSRGSSSESYGSTRPTVSVVSGDTYGSVHLGLCAQSLFTEAESFRNTGSGTTSQVAVTGAGGGNVVQDTQAANTAETVSIPAGSVPDSLIGVDAVYVKARAVTAGATASLAMGTGAATGPGTATTTVNVLTWTKLAAPAARTTDIALGVRAWRSAGTGNVQIDRVAALPLQRRQLAGLDYLGAEDHAQMSRVDARWTYGVTPR